MVSMFEACKGEPSDYVDEPGEISPEAWRNLSADVRRQLENRVISIEVFTMTVARCLDKGVNLRAVVFEQDKYPPGVPESQKPSMGFVQCSAEKDGFVDEPMYCTRKLTLPIAHKMAESINRVFRRRLESREEHGSMA